ncbi:MAG TPA: hypothetical protein VGR37_09010 [Longimicrobiaceae bacterium]|nr:hypothetical protein [Longimicrobiaceae bacterium]
MKAIRARLAAILASFVMAALVNHGIAEATPELTGRIAGWVEHTFELVLFLGYAVLHPWMQKRWNPTGAFTGEAARRLEHVAHVNGS